MFLQESRHVITRSLGPEPTVQIDIEGPYPVMPGDVYVLCSDGLTGHVQDAEIGIIARELPPQEACRLLVNLANLRGGSDNVTVVAVHVGGGPAGAEPEEEPPAPSRGLGWGWLITVWLLALLFVVGVTSILFNKFLEGVYLVAAAAFSAVGHLYWLKSGRGGSLPARPRRDRDDDRAVPHGFGPLERGLSQPSGQPAGRAAAGSDRGTLVDRLAGLRSGLRGGSRPA